MGQSQSLPTMSPGTKASKTTITSEEEDALRRRLRIDTSPPSSFCVQMWLHRLFLHVEGLPLIEEEGHIEDQVSFSIRGEDEALFHAYLAAFLKTWGAYVTMRTDVPHYLTPPRLPPSWCIVGYTTRQIWDLITRQ